jgi:hypothetical protein
LQQEQRYFFVSISRPALRSSQPPARWVSEGLSLGIMLLGHETDNSYPSTAEIKKVWRVYFYYLIGLHDTVLN